MTIDECFGKIEYYLDEARSTGAASNLYLEKCLRLATAYREFAEVMILRENPVKFTKGI
jgi:hypothetical protein